MDTQKHADAKQNVDGDWLIETTEAVAAPLADIITPRRWYPAEKRGVQMNGMLVSALTGLSVFVMGMIIVHLTPPDDRASK